MGSRAGLGNEPKAGLRHPMSAALTGLVLVQARVRNQFVRHVCRVIAELFMAESL